MNNTTTIALAAIVVILISATLVVGATSTKSLTAAFAYKKDNGKGKGNGNTVVSKGYENCLLLVTKAIDKNSDGIQQQDLVISKLLGECSSAHVSKTLFDESCSFNTTTGMIQTTERKDS
jgi:hypothetical protein